MFFLALVLGAAAADDPLVRPTTAGSVSGRTAGDTTAWLGVPFAAPPVGELRWRAPRPPDSWSGVRPATRFADACLQAPRALRPRPEHPRAYGQEDCLYLNVWAPTGASHTPVMVWLHGGGNTLGETSTYDGAELAAEQHIVVVTAAYRLGPLGWMHEAALTEGGTPEEASGNFGLLDQIAALRWVQANIAAFGGDPAAVTLAGESAGGQDTYGLLVSPLTHGLFARAIAQSPVIRVATPTEAEAWADQGGLPHSSRELFAKAVTREGAATDPRAFVDDAATFAPWARALSGEALVEAWIASASTSLGMLDMPTTIGDGVVLPSVPWTEAFARPDGWANVPVLTGSNRDEARLFLMGNPALVRNWTVLDEPRYLAVSDGLSRAWKALFVDAAADAMVRSGQSQVYVYRCDWAGERSPLGLDARLLIGAAHATELPLLWPSRRMDAAANLLWDRPAREALGHRLRGYWGAFVRDGRPALTGEPAWPSWPEGRALILDAPPAGVRVEASHEDLATILADADHNPHLHPGEILEGLRRIRFVP